MISTTAVSPRQIPLAPQLPLMGALPYLIRQPFAYLKQARQQCGDIFRLNLGLFEAVLLNHPQHAQHVLRDNARNYLKEGNMYSSARRMFGNGLVTSQGDYWLRQRRMMQPHFHRRHLAGLFDLMLQAIDEELARWPKTAVSFNLAPAMNRITMKVIVRTMFGTQLSDAALESVGEAMMTIMDYIMVGTLNDSLPSWLPMPGYRRYQAAVRTFDDTVYRVIAQCRADENAIGLLPMLINLVDAETGEQMSDLQLRDEVTSIFVAGYDTTAVAMAWTADYLAREQALQKQVADSINEAVGQEAPTLASLRELGMVKRVFQETLRIRPSGWVVPRLAAEDDEIDGYPVPAGTQIMLLVNQIHHHPDFWEEPEQYDPDRFLSKTPGHHSFAYVPFGAGQRQCIGRDFAYMEGQLILIRLLQKYRLNPATAQPLQPQLTSTLRPKGKVPIQLCAT